MPPDALVLGFDTSAAHCAAALLRGDRILAARAEAMGRGQAERLMPMLEEMLAGAGAGWRDLAAIGVGTGPGNFTGVRISVAAARGLAVALAIPAIGISGFEAGAALAREGGAATGPVWVAAPAPQGMVHLWRSADARAEIATTGATAPLLRAENDPGPLDAALIRLDQTDPRDLAVAIARIAALRRGRALPRP
ncbi:MAG: tRNA (adenosine(37)-N6)-threonylcarbamoyltransferase complex dimerization subunit type 1 TsaB, partial [Alphaproteobacteria bacterium HGW-Alphaproteobacteria-6]